MIPADRPPHWSNAVFIWRVRAVFRRLYWRLTDWKTGTRAPTLALKPVNKNLATLKNINRKINVGFVVCDPAKWSVNSLFHRLQNDPAFNCGFLCTLSDTDLRLGPAERPARYARTRKFFANIGPIWGDLYHSETDRMHPSGAIQCDIVFIQQPWGMQDLPRQLAGRVLSAYVHYGFAIISNDRMQFQLPDFHRYLWTYFAQTDAQRASILGDSADGIGPPQTVLAVGYPKLDAYLAPACARSTAGLWPHSDDTSRRRVIFAPHHAFGASTLNLATFTWSGPAMLALAKRHPEIDFVLKPHPNMGHSFRRGADIGGQSYDEWLAEWACGANRLVFDSGLYFDLFRSSDVMITDSGSFLAEYLPTGQPIIRLINPGAAAFNASGAALADAFYPAQDSKALQQTFDQLILGQDPLAPIRQHKRALVIPFDRPSAQIIVDYLDDCFCSSGKAGAEKGGTNTP